MSKRIWATIQRAGQGANMTDNTPVVIWEHEIAILDDIHGEGAVTVIEDHDQLVDASVKASIDSKSGEKITRETLLQRRIKELGLGESFSTDPIEEYSRLERVYGMHPDVKNTYVERIYGRFEEGRFTKALGVEALEELTAIELRKRCDALELPHKPADKKADLIASIRAFTTETQTARELQERHKRRAA